MAFIRTLVFSLSCILAMLAASCSSSTLRISSVPEGAEVKHLARDGTVRTLGQTPLELESRQHAQIFDEFSQIEVSKSGYLPQSALVPKFSSSGDGRLNFNLKNSELPKVCQAHSDAINILTEGVASAASLVNRRRLDEAARLLEDLATKYASVPVVFDLLGNVYFLQKSFARSLESYKQSDRLRPNHLDTLRMIERLESIQGRVPASGG